MKKFKDIVIFYTDSGCFTLRDLIVTIVVIAPIIGVLVYMSYYNGFNSENYKKMIDLYKEKMPGIRWW